MKKNWKVAIGIVLYVAVFVAMKLMFEANSRSAINAHWTTEKALASPGIDIPCSIMAWQIAIAIFVLAVAVLVAGIGWLAKKRGLLPAK